MQTIEFKTAGFEDLPVLELLINSAYRGESSKAGWTTEADLLEGIRTDQEGLRELVERPGSVILTAIQNQRIIGCVNLQKMGNRLYLGMLTVSPQIQARGIGKELLKASEAYAINHGCQSVIMTVISVRTELIEWYERRGYHFTGERQPFPSGNPRFGIPLQDLEFVVMEKRFS
jgi:ribosomal protein S18 acetylase RimI-like enzyme